MNLFAATREKLDLAYLLFAFTVVLALLAATTSFLRPLLAPLVVFLALPANVFLQFTAPVRFSGMAGDAVLVLQFAAVLLLSVIYLYVLASLALAVRDSLEPSSARSRRR